MELSTVHRKPIKLSSSSPDLNTPGSRIRNARIERNLTIEVLAAKIGTSSTALGKIERGKSEASMETLRKLSETLDVAVSYLGCFETMPEDTFGQRLKKARCYLGLTKIELAAELSVDAKSIYLWELDKVLPSPQYYNRINHTILASINELE